MDKKFSLKNFVEKEAEEEDFIKKKDKLDLIQMKDTQYSSEINKDDDSYGIPSEDNTEKIASKKRSKELISHRLLFQKEIEKDKKKGNNQHLKRKRIPIIEKKNNKKRAMEHAKKNINKIESSLGIVNGKLNIGFAENKENSNLNDKNDGNSNNPTPAKKFKDEDDEDVLVLKMSNERKKIENINKKMNNDFIKRIKENENFIKNNNIIIDDDSETNNEKMKGNKNDLGLKKNNSMMHPKLKLYNLKGAFLNKKK
jgi:hypothetical protein